jgi:hypothetical protein
MEMKMMLSTKKGILLTLLVVVLFVLMLGEIISYVVINVNYDVLTQSASLASTQGTTGLLIKTSATGLLHNSLYAALGALTNFESSPSSRSYLFVNNTQYFLQSLMTNGTLYGSSFAGGMGGALIGNFSSMINLQMRPQGISIKLVGGNLTVFQGSPSTINATYTAMALVNGTSGSFTYPIYATTSVPLNGTRDLSGIERASPVTISIQPSLPVAQRIGGYATSGSKGPFMFAFGTAVVIAGAPSCANVAPNFLNTNYILVTFNAINVPGGACGMGGVITTVPSSSGFNTPYLIYPSLGFNGMFYNGTQLLLNGPGLASYSLANLQSAIQAQQFFTSPYAPSYLDQAQGVLTQRPNTGLFSFSLLSRQTPYFTDSVSTDNVFVPAGNIVLPSTFTISFWINKNAYQTNCDGVIGIPDSTFFSITSQSANGCAAGYTQNTVLTVSSVSGSTTNTYNSMGIQPNVWTYAAVVFSQGKVTWYINGNKANSYNGAANPTPDSNALVIGGGRTSFNGSITNVQIYNAPLAPLDIQAIYRSGIGGFPTRAANIIAWYPLNRNTNDYSGFSRNGIIDGGVVFKTLNGYYGDPIYKNIATNYSVGEIEGAVNCQNINACTAQTLPHLYLSGAPLETSGAAVLNESASLNLGNALIPQVLSFTSNNYVQESNSLPWTKSATATYSVSIWVYPKAGNGIILDEYNASSGTHDAWISLSAGTGYISYWGAPEVCESIGAIPLNTWTNIVLTYNSASSPSLNGYVNSVNRYGASPTARVALSAPMFYGLGKTDGTNCGSGLPFTGLMSDFQMYSTALSAAQVKVLYLNDSVNVGPAAPANIIMPLSGPYLNIQNETTERLLNNFGVFYVGSTPCSVLNVTLGTCGLGYTPP